MNDIRIPTTLSFFFVTRGVWVSLHAPQLILGPTEHPASPVDR